MKLYDIQVKGYDDDPITRQTWVVAPDIPAVIKMVDTSDYPVIVSLVCHGQAAVETDQLVRHLQPKQGTELRYTTERHADKDQAYTEGFYACQEAVKKILEGK